MVASIMRERFVFTSTRSSKNIKPNSFNKQNCQLNSVQVKTLYYLPNTIWDLEKIKCLIIFLKCLIIFLRSQIFFSISNLGFRISETVQFIRCWICFIWTFRIPIRAESANRPVLNATTPHRQLLYFYKNTLIF